jgi:hypothetical protein
MPHAEAEPLTKALIGDTPRMLQFTNEINNAKVNWWRSYGASTWYARLNFIDPVAVEPPSLPRKTAVYLHVIENSIPRRNHGLS